MTTQPPARPKRGPGCLGLAARAALGGLILILALLPLGAAYQANSSAQDLARFSPPGQLVDVGGFRLHLHCSGEGSPTVVLESGLGDGAYVWYLVQKQVVTFTRVCSYDRPGLGWSDFVNRQFTRDAVASNLYTLLKKAGILGPYLLVGHSAGGIYVRAFAHLYPDEVAGMVLVDSSHESQALRYEQQNGDAKQYLDSVLHLCDLIAPFGILRLFDLPGLSIEDSPLPERIKAAATASMNRDTYCATIENEMNATDIDMSLPSGPTSLGSLPLVVITAGQDPGAGGQPDNMQGASSYRNATWLQLQRELVALSSHSRQIITSQSSHYIHWDQPELVIQVIQQLVGELRG